MLETGLEPFALHDGAHGLQFGMTPGTLHPQIHAKSSALFGLFRLSITSTHRIESMFDGFDEGAFRGRIVRTTTDVHSG